MRITLVLAHLTLCLGAYAQSAAPIQDDGCSDCASHGQTPEAAPQDTVLIAELPVADQRRLAEESGVLSQYERAIHDKIFHNWAPPAATASDVECVINVAQVPSGEVVRVGFGSCNADEAVRSSIEAAVRRASPLPRPPTFALFSRNLEVTLDEVRVRFDQ